jgi:hypothetical protein
LPFLVTNTPQIWCFLHLLTPSALVQSLPSFTGTSCMASFLLACPSQGHPPSCYSTNVSKTQSWHCYSLDKSPFELSCYGGKKSHSCNSKLSRTHFQPLH